MNRLFFVFFIFVISFSTFSNNLDTQEAQQYDYFLNTNNTNVTISAEDFSQMIKKNPDLARFVKQTTNKKPSFLRRLFKGIGKTVKFLLVGFGFGALLVAMFVGVHIIFLRMLFLTPLLLLGGSR